MILKNRMVLCAAAVACLAISANAAVVSAETARLEVPSENRIYYGEEITAENITSVGQGEITLTECSLTEPLIEFIINPSEIGTADRYTPDLERINFNFYNPAVPDKHLTVVFGEHYIFNSEVNGKDYEQLISVLAAGGSQSLGAEWRGNREQNKDKLSTRYSGNIAQTFDGYVRSEEYVDENGDKIAVGTNRAVRVFYDATENVLYTDVGLQNGFSKYEYNDGSTTKYRWIIRDFNRNDYLNENLNPITTTWNGFEQNETVKYEITFANVATGKTPSVVVTKLCGQTMLESPIIVSTPSQGKSGVRYPIPAPKYFDENLYTEKNFADVGGQYKVEKRTDGGLTTVVAYSNFTTTSSFMPNDDGNYIITYKVGSEQKTINIEVLDELAEVTLTPNTLPESSYIKQSLDVGVKCIYDFQSQKPEVDLEIFNNEILVDKFSVGESLQYIFNLNGNYELVYTCTDYLNRKARAQTKINVQRYYVSWSDGITENTSVPMSANITIPSVTDIEIFDIVFDKVVDIQLCEISVAYNGGVYAPLSEQDFEAQGEYSIKYRIKYDAYSEIVLDAYRRIFKYNDFFGVIEVDGLPSGTKISEPTQNNVELKLKAVKGGEIVIPYNYFKRLMDEVKIIDADGESTDITENMTKGQYAFIPEKSGVYEITAVKENEYYRAVKVLRIDVREKWITFSSTNDVELSLNTDLSEYLPVCTDFYGNAITDYITTVSYYGEQVADKKLSKLGVYEVVYTYSTNGENVSATRTVTTYDAAAPSITISEPQKSALLNGEVELAHYAVSDDSGLKPKVEVTVTLNGEQVIIYNNRFKADKQGEYVVNYLTSDASGNTAVSRYTVKVSSSSCAIICFDITDIALAVAVALFTIFFKKKII